MSEKPKRNYTSRRLNPKKPRIRIGAGRKYTPNVERSEEPKDMHEIELAVKQAFKESNNVAEAAEKVMTVVRQKFLTKLNLITEHTNGSHQLLMERLLVLKTQLK